MKQTGFDVIEHMLVIYVIGLLATAGEDVKVIK
jgi:Tfp pilus assembly major pilin PilA